MIPFDSPFYPQLPAHYQDVFFQLVFFRADPTAMGPLLPDPLQAAADGRCVAMGIRVPKCRAYGSFDEAVVQMACTFGDQSGWYCSHVWHNGPAGIAAGREIYGTPKFLADIQLDGTRDHASTAAGTGGTVEIEITSQTPDIATPQDLPTLAPSWRLKVIPRADGPGPAIMQLVDGAPATQDLQVAWCQQGEGSVRFSQSAARDLTGLAPLSYDGAFHMQCSYSEGFAVITHDYLI
jgi:acetoacetate decarboxylase